MKRMKLLVLTAAAAAVMAASAAPAHALTTATNPYTNDTTALYMGYISAWGGTYVIMVRLSDSSCSTSYVGGSSLNDNVAIYGGNATDFITLARSGYPQSACGVTISSATYNGHYVDVYGQGGVDYLEGGAGSDDWLFGGAGNDNIRTYSPQGHISGDDGDDYLVSYASSSNDATLGGSGNDCLYDWSGAASTFDCGAGTDTAISPAPANRVNCERVASTCN
jgi:hypothetical protein